MRSALLAWLVHSALLIAWRQWQPEGILFYQGLALAVPVCAGQAAWLFRRRAGPWVPRLKDVLIGFLLIYAYVFTVPTTVDRAYSVRMLLELRQAPEGLTRAQIEHWFAEEFQGQGGVERRLREQLVTGNVSESAGQYQLTPMGRRLAGVFAALRQLYASAGPERR